MTKHTLIRQIFIWVAPTVLLAILLISQLAYYSTKKEVNELYDARLVNDTHVLWALVSDELDEETNIENRKISGDELADNDYDNDFSDARMFRVWHNGKLALFSDTAPEAPQPPPADGFSYLEYENAKWRTYSIAIPKQNVVIEVGEKVLLRDKLGQEILLDLLWPLLLLGPVLGLLIWFGIRYGLKTIRELIAQIHTRTSDDLSPLVLINLPQDLMPLAQSINQLFSKLEHSFTAERRFSDHAAHQLRTPLAIVNLHLQMLEQSKTDSERQKLIEDLHASTERASKLVDQLLTAARVDHQALILTHISLYQTCAQVMAIMGPLAVAKQIELSLEGAEEAAVKADQNLVELLLINIIENAIKYTPEGGRVVVNIQSDTQNWLLTVVDTGPGIPEQEQALVFERFYRINRSEVPGSGLGLSIAAQIVARFNGTIAMKSAYNNGLIVEIQLPKASDFNIKKS